MYDSPTEVFRVVGRYLSEPLRYKDKEALKLDLVDLDAVRMKLSEARVDWLKLLHEKESQMLHPKDKDLTEMDRKVMLNASVAVIKRDYEFLVSLEKLVEERLALGRELLKI